MSFSIYVDGDVSNAELEAFSAFAAALIHARNGDPKPVVQKEVSRPTEAKTSPPAKAEPPAPRERPTSAKPASAKPAPDPVAEEEAPTIQDAIKVASELVTTGRSKEVKETLEKFEAKRVSELKPGDIADFIAAIEAL